MVIYYLYLVGFGILFTAFLALVFSLLTIWLGKASVLFEMEGPEDWTFFAFYIRYLIVAAAFILVTLTLSELGLGLLAVAFGYCSLCAAYKRVFDAEWVTAIVIGSIGGFIATTLFLFLINGVIIPLGLIEAPPEPGQIDQERFEGPDDDFDADAGRRSAGRSDRALAFHRAAPAHETDRPTANVSPLLALSQHRLCSGDLPCRLAAYPAAASFSPPPQGRLPSR